MLKKHSERLSNSALFVIGAACMVTPWFTTVAQTTFGGASIGFADAQVCPPDTIEIPEAIRQTPSLPSDELPTKIEADTIEIEESTQHVVLTGNAQILQGNRGVYADKMVYDQESYQARAEGNVRFYTPNGDAIRAESLQIEVDTFIGEASNVKIQIADPSPEVTQRRHQSFYEDYSIFAPLQSPGVAPSQTNQLDTDTVYARARAEAEKVEFESDDFERLSNVSMSTCVEGNDDVLLVAKEIELDHVAGVGSAKSMKVKFKGVPIFYFPSVTFPINDQRKSGFLFPGIGYNKESGYMVEVPYYINISPQQDATVIPRVLSHRGVQLYGEYRYLTRTSQGAIKVEVLPSDKVYQDKDRYAGIFRHQQSFGGNWRAKVDAQTVSDDAYLRDFSNDIDIASSSFVPQNAELIYSGRVLRFESNVSTYETVNTAIALANRPYETVPRLSLSVKPQRIGVLRAGIDSEYIEYKHDDTTKVSGSRFRVKPYLSMPLEAVYGYITPKVSFHSVQYSLDNYNGTDNSPSFSVPVASIDGGLVFERSFSRSGGNYLQTLEPRLFYLNIPEETDQNGLPTFDTGLGANTSIDHFFRENRFFGGDRIGDTHQVSLGLTSRVINDDTGEERFNIKFGQVFYLEDRNVGLTADATTQTASRSDFLVESEAKLNADWSINGFARWAEESKQIDYSRLSATYDHSDRRRASLSYISNRGTDEQVNLHASVPIGPKWQLDTRTNYSMQTSDLQAAEFGLSFDGCCWAMRFGVQRYLDSANEYDNRYMFSFEIDDLGRVGSSL